jgi:hypothetical protein
MRHLSSMSASICVILHAFEPCLIHGKHYCGFIIITYDAVLNPISVCADLLSEIDFPSVIAFTSLPRGSCAIRVLFLRHLRHGLIHDQVSLGEPPDVLGAIHHSGMMNGALSLIVIGGAGCVKPVSLRAEPKVDVSG